MSIGRKLWSSAASLLRRGSRPRPHLQSDAHLNHLPRELAARSFLLPPRTALHHDRGGSRLLEPRVPVGSSYSTEPTRVASVCWNCGAAAPFLACASCGSVQPVDPAVDYFQIFGLERGYEIRGGNLEDKYKDWQKKLHPDLVHSKSEQERTFAAEQSARVIDAYRTLSKPLSRALYLLRLEGVHVDEEERVMDLELLAEMMDIREAVEEANDTQALKEIQSKVQSKLEDWSKSFEEAFKKRDFDYAISSIHRMRYYDRAIEEIVKKL